MDTAITMPLRSLNPSVVQDLQEKYPGAVVRIDTEIPAENTGMDEEQFWDIIALLDWGRKRTEDIVAPAIQALSQHPEVDIFRFEDLLAQKLFALDGAEFAKPLGWDNAESPYFSVDVFLYARCCAVANGKAFYEKVLNDPSMMPKEHTFEPLLYLAEKAHRLKTGTDRYDYLPALSYETFSNHDAWPGMPSLSDLIEGK